MAGYTPDPKNAAILGSVNQLLSKSTEISNSFPGVELLAALPGKELYFDSELQLDTDGWVNGAGKGDPDYDPNTSLRYKDGSSLDSNSIPYFVLPKSGWASQFGISLGDYAAV